MVKEASPTARILLVGTQKDWDPVDWTSQGSAARRKDGEPVAHLAAQPANCMQHIRCTRLSERPLRG